MYRTKCRVVGVVGGDDHQSVGSKLAELGERHQVLVVTHLAQVAALADRHVVVAKRVEGDVTVATASVVDGDGRVEEVARMLSGDQAAESARRHAADLIAEKPNRSRT